MTANYRHVLALLRQPWAIWPHSKEVAAIRDVMDRHLRGERLTDSEIETRLTAAAAGNGPRAGMAAGGSVAIIPVYGVIMPKAGVFDDMSGGMSVQAFQRAFRSAMADPDIGAIVLDIDSPGGATDLLTELAAEIRAGRDRKPVTAVANTMVCSAAYWLASAATEIVATPSSVHIGAIGVFTIYQDESGALEQAGLKVDVIAAGKYKGEDLGLGPLPADARAHMQSQIDDVYEQFVTDVAKGRGVKVSAVRAGYGEGRTLTAKMAKAAGMVDRIDTFEAVVDQVARQTARTASRSAAASSPNGYVVAIADDDLADRKAELDAERERLLAAGADPAELETPASPSFAFELELYRRRHGAGSHAAD